MRVAASLTLSRRACLVGALVCLSLTTVRADDPKPDASIKTKNVEASVFLDDKIKADPALSADCLAEGRKWLEKQAAAAAAPRQQQPQPVPRRRSALQPKNTPRSRPAHPYLPHHAPPLS